MERPEQQVSYFERNVFSLFVTAIAVLVMHVTISLLNPARSALLMPRVFALLLSIGFLAAYLGTKSHQLKLWIFFLELVGLAVSATITEEISLKHGWTVIFHYVGVVLIAISGSLVAPEIAVPTVAAFVLLAITPLAHTFLWWTPVERAALGREEPWVTVAIVLFSTVIWYYRRRGTELAREKEKLFVQNQLFKQFALLLLGAQHLINSPLQSIAANIRLIEMENPGAQSRIKAVDRALDVVQRVGDIIAFGDEHIRWDDGDLPDDIEGFNLLVGKIAREMAESATRSPFA